MRRFWHSAAAARQSVETVAAFEYTDVVRIVAAVAPVAVYWVATADVRVLAAQDLLVSSVVTARTVFVRLKTTDCFRRRC
jgi:hypothetical protein